MVRLTMFVLLACTPSRLPDTVVYASGADLESANPLVTIHPLARQVQRYALFVTLARYDQSLTPQPYYGRRWEWSNDHRALTVHLVPGVFWQDSVPTTAQDVVFTLDLARDPSTGYPRASDLVDLSSVTAPDDSTVVMAFRSPQARFPDVLCDLPVVPKHVLQGVAPNRLRAAAFSTAPTANGPFRFVSHRVGEQWVLVRNPTFPVALGGPPRLERLVIAVVDEATTKFAGLVSGDLDVAGISPPMVPIVERDPTLRLLEYPVLQSTTIVFNVHRTPFDDVRVRRAVSLALDRQRIVDAALLGHAIPAASAIPPEHPYATPMRMAHDTALADSLLDAAGWRRGPDGLRRRGGSIFVAEMLTVSGAEGAAEQLVQADLASVGIRVELRQRELAAFLAEARATPKRFDLLFTGVPGDLSLAYISAMFDSHAAGGALDYAGYHTPRLDSLLARARAAPDAESARRAWRDVEHELLEQVPVAWVYHSRGVQALSRRVAGVQMDLRGELVSLPEWQTTPPPPAHAAR